MTIKAEVEAEAEEPPSDRAVTSAPVRARVLVPLYLALAAVVTWPMPLHAGTSLNYGAEPVATVPLFNLWTLRWNEIAIGDLSRSYGQLHLLSKMSRKLLGCPASSDAHDIIADFGRQVFPEDSGRVYLGAGPESDMVSVAAWGDLPRRPERVRPTGCLALRQGQPHAFTAAAGEPLCPHLEGSPIESSLCVPLEAQGETLGLLTLLPGAGGSAHPAAQSTLNESKRSLAVALAQSVGLGVGNLRMRERLELVDGRFEVESQPGGGTTIVAEVPTT